MTKSTMRMSRPIKLKVKATQFVYRWRVVADGLDAALILVSPVPCASRLLWMVDHLEHNTPQASRHLSPASAESRPLGRRGQLRQDNEKADWFIVLPR
jgi:hypothetical protein